MAQIFISYSRADTLFVEQLIPLLEEVFKQHTFWYDQHIDGGDLWWEKILTAINESSVFIFLLSHDSLTSDYCQAEFREALRLNIPFLPVIVRSKTNVEDAPPDLQENIKERNWIDLSNGFKDAKANARLYSALNQILTQAVQLPTEPINPQPTPKPNVTSKPVIVRASLRRDPAIIAALIGAVAVIIGAIITVGPQFLNQVTPLPTFTPTTLAQVPTPHATNTALPTLDIAFVVATLDAQATIDQASLNARSTIGARITEDAVGTQSITNQTATAAQRTLTPTANVTASIEAYRTQQGQTATAQTIVNLTGTASAWTSTPTVTKTPVPSLTPTQTYTPTAILTNTSTPTATLTLPPEQIALTPIKLNADWIPIESYFDGVMMVLVPAGCFMMGSTTSQLDEQPVHQQCIEEPFWIDIYEVYNRQFELLGGVSAFPSHWLNFTIVEELR